MSKKKPVRYFAADFETTVYDGQTTTEVWSAAIAELFKDEVLMFRDIDSFMKFIFEIGEDINIKFHNVKFDGSFILSWLFKSKFKHAYDSLNGFPPFYQMPKHSFTYMISAMGQWYRITIRNGTQKIVIEDSYKLFPLKLADVAEAFKTKHKKLEMNYVGLRYPGYIPSKQEEDYIKSDVYVLKEALEFMYREGHRKMTIGSNCLAEYKEIVGPSYDEFFPNQYKEKLDLRYGAETVGAYVHKSYKGGWCYYVPEKTKKIIKNGKTFDVNSLYPSMMHSSSGNYYPVGDATPWVGEIPDILTKDNEHFSKYFYFLRVKCKFKLKEGYLPCIQIKNNGLYRATEWLNDSYPTIKGIKVTEENSEGVELRPTLTFTCVDWELINKHYDISDLEILDGVYYQSRIGLFDEYINKYAEIKKTSKGGYRTIAKLYLNNLYGKFAASTESSYKIAELTEDGRLVFHIVLEDKKKPGYIPIGSAITAYSRRFTITQAQKCYHGPYLPGFCYADTDSIHGDFSEEDINLIPQHDTEFNHWKKESEWSIGWFLRQKSYIEKVNGKYDIKCCGMPDNCKELLDYSITNRKPDPRTYNKLTESQKKFIAKKRTIKDFVPGLKIEGKLMPKQIPGGTLLVPTTYEMR